MPFTHPQFLPESLKKTAVAACACLAGASALGATLATWAQGSGGSNAEVRHHEGVEPRTVDPAPAPGNPPGLGNTRGQAPSPEPRLSLAVPALRVPSRVLPGPDPDEG